MANIIENEYLLFDYTNGLFNKEGLPDKMNKLFESVKDKIKGLKIGDHINYTENRKVLHHLLRANSKSLVYNNIPEYNEIISEREKIKEFTNNVRSNNIKTINNKNFKNIISIGIGGSYLGVDSLSESLKYHPYCKNNLQYNIKFLSNIDPINFIESVINYKPEDTLIIIVSKSFTTSETKDNLEIVLKWASKYLKDIDINEYIKKHVVAITSNVELAKSQNINYIFKIWDSIGGRFSVTSAVGILPLSLIYGYDFIENILKGAEYIDDNYFNQNWDNNISFILGAISYINYIENNLNSNCIVPYFNKMKKFVNYLQQLHMESLGKFNKGVIVYGDVGTNCQHSFFQQLHQGTKSFIEFIVFNKSQLLDNRFNNSYDYIKYIDINDINLQHEKLNNNCFSQIKALTNGKQNNENINKHFEGKRENILLQFKEYCGPFELGMLIAIYEHKVSTMGFLLNINSYDQFGVELGKEIFNKIYN